MRRGFRLLALALAVMLVAGRTTSAQNNFAVSLFERYLDALRLQAGFPSLSVAIVQDGRPIWERGFGLRDVEASLPAQPDTPYYIGDISQTFASLLTLQCIERGELVLSDSIGRWVPQAPNPQASLLQVLAHASGAGGPVFRYDPARFAALTNVVQSCYELPYGKVIAAEIFDRLAMADAVPGRDVLEAPAAVRDLFDAADLAQYAGNLSRMALPYRVDRRGRATRSDPAPAGIDAAHGVIASARDLAWFDAGLDRYDIVREPTIEAAWTNANVSGVSVPTGLGWFVQYYQGERLVWHFGSVNDAYSSLILKVPARRLTLIMLANSDGLSVPYDLHEGDVTKSVFALTFLRLFI